LITSIYSLFRYSLHLLALVPLTVSAALLTADEKDFIEHHPVWRLHADNSWPPYNYREFGEAKGYTVELMLLVAQKVGAQVEFVEAGPWQQSAQLLHNKDVDLSSYLAEGNEHSDLARFNQRALFTMSSAIVSGNSGQTSNKFNQLAGPFAVVSGSHEAQVLAQRYPDKQAYLVEDTLRLIEAVASGDAVAGLGNEKVIAYYLSKIFTSQLRLFSLNDVEGFAPTQWKVAVRHDWPLLPTIIDKALADVSSQRIASLQSKWFSQSSSPSVNVLNLNKNERDYLRNKGELTYCSHPNLMPLEGKLNDQSIGVTGDYLNYLAKSLAIELKLVTAHSWAEAQFKFKMRECDFLSLSFARKNRLAYAQYTKPYLSLPVAVAIHQKTPYTANLDSLTGQAIGYARGNPTIEHLKEAYPLVTFVQTESHIQGLEKVRDKQLFGYLGALPLLTYELQHNFPNLLIGSQLPQTFLLGAAVRSDEPILATILNKAIEKMDVKLHTSIMNTWAPVTYRPIVDYRLVWAVVVIGLIIIAAIAYSYYVLRLQFNKLQSLSTQDRLTGLYNRYTIDMVMAEQVSQYRFSHKPFSVILGDVDHFKLLNDRYGHLVGDRVLKSVADLFSVHSSGSDLVGRWGGEEFIIICPGRNERQARRIADTLREQIESYAYSDVGKVTCSFGVAQYAAKQSITDLMQQADRCLYRSKRLGRNRVTSFSDYHLSSREEAL